MTPTQKGRLRVFALSLVLALSMASYLYMNTVDNTLHAKEDPVLVEELQEKKGEILPDVQLIKALMQRTMDFMSIGRRF